MKTPLYCLKQFPNVYDPSEDSFLLLDSLEKLQQDLVDLDPVICLEIGCGSGIVSTFLSQLLKTKPLMISTDINIDACRCTLQTSHLNNLGSVNAICADGLSFISPKYYKKIDVVVFNPPYVVTSPEEIGDHSRAWAGGIDGRQGNASYLTIVIDKILPLIMNLLSDVGLFFLLTIKENKISEIQELMINNGFNSKLVKSRKAGIEGLSVTCFYR